MQLLVSDVVLPGGDVYFAFTWLVVQVIVFVIHVGTAAFSSRYLWRVVCDGVSLFQTVPGVGEDAVSLLRQVFEVVVPVEGFLDA